MPPKRKGRPSAGPAANLPRFGTDGWRAIIADQFTFDNVRRIAAAMSRYLRDEGDREKPVAVAYDTRFMSREFAAAFAETAAACGTTVWLSKDFCPTPALSFAVRKHGLALGVMITASHNPYTYSGIKFKASYGGPAMVPQTREIEEYLHALGSPDMARDLGGRVVEKDFRPAYYRQVAKFVDLSAISRFKEGVVFNPMFGAGIGSVDSVLRDAGVKGFSINAEPNPLFGGGGPEPILQNLRDQVEAIRVGRAALGLATDGDADRFGVLDADGSFVQLHDLMPLLFRHLVATRGWKGNVVRTTSMHDTVDRVAADLGRTVAEVPVGFKNVCEKMLEQDVLVGGEESGGFGYKNHIPERDGVLSCLLLVEMLATRGETMKQAVARLRRETGPFAYGRIDRHFPVPALKANFEALKSAPPAKFGGVAVDRVSTIDGIKFHFRGGSWMLMRTSDTEPLGRIYVGSTDDPTVQKILKAGAEKLFKKR
jgi:phosphomannomutase